MGEIAMNPSHCASRRVDEVLWALAREMVHLVAASLRDAQPHRLP
jgi:hypothetical protein